MDLGGRLQRAVGAHWGARTGRAGVAMGRGQGRIEKEPKPTGRAVSAHVAAGHPGLASGRDCR